MRRLLAWKENRSFSYLLTRSLKLARRYGLSPRRAEARTLEFVALLAEQGCSPTLATPGDVVRRHRAAVRTLQERGVEIAVHGYDHVDFRTLGPDEIRWQLTAAAAAFDEAGIRHTGLRCPYLSYDRSMRASLTPDVLYSSNEAIWWDTLDAGTPPGARDIYFSTLERFYRPSPASERPAVPRTFGDLVEIPVSLPDDLLALDGLGLDAEHVGRLWLEVLACTHARGEAFVVLTHPETAGETVKALQRLLREARALTPPVWVSRLDEIAAWWRRRAAWNASIDRAHVRVTAPDEATILSRLIGGPGASPWFGTFQVATGRDFPLAPDGTLPFVGVPGGDGLPLVDALRDEGYVVEVGEAASRCGTVLDPLTLGHFPSERAVLAFLDAADTPLIRIWRWPNGARSALSVTGDLDALSLVDYAARVRLLGRRTGADPRADGVRGRNGSR